MEKLQKTILFLSLLVLIGLSIIGYLLIANKNQVSGNFPVIKTVTPLDAVTSTTTSSAIDIQGAKKVTLFLTTNIGTIGKATTTFGVTVSQDGTNYVNYNKLIDNVANTNAQTLTRVTSKSYDSTTTSAVLSMDLINDSFKYFKASTTQTYGTGGVLRGATVKSIVEF